MKIPFLLPVLSLSLGCSAGHEASELFTTSEVRIDTVSAQSADIYIDFTVPEGETCPGVRVRTVGMNHWISFVRGAEGFVPDFDVVTCSVSEPSDAGLLRAYLPSVVPAMLTGGQATLLKQGPGGAVAITTCIFKQPELATLMEQPSLDR